MNQSSNSRKAKARFVVPEKASIDDASFLAAFESRSLPMWGHEAMVSLPTSAATRGQDVLERLTCGSLTLLCM